MRDGLLAQSQPLQPADTLREQLTRIFDTARTKKEGLRRIDLWRQRVEKSGQRCFDGVLTLLDTWLELIATSLYPSSKPRFCGRAEQYAERAQAALRRNL
jgi:hypothetical protein